jgi:hypothetical protein
LHIKTIKETSTSWGLLFPFIRAGEWLARRREKTEEVISKIGALDHFIKRHGRSGMPGAAESRRNNFSKNKSASGPIGA